MCVPDVKKKFLPIFVLKFSPRSCKLTCHIVMARKKLCTRGFECIIIELVAMTKFCRKTTRGCGTKNVAIHQNRMRRCGCNHGIELKSSSFNSIYVDIYQRINFDCAKS